MISQFLPLLQAQDAGSRIPMPESALNHEGSFWFPRQASEVAGQVDFLIAAIFWISAIFFVLIVGFMVYFAIRFRRRGKAIEPLPSHSHNTALEIFWSVIPSIILVWMFYAGAKGFFEMRVATADAEEIRVTASKWNWVFTYPNGDISSELHLVLDKPVKLVMESRDVLHSMYVPAFRQKVDVVPGRYTYAYINPTEVGTFRLACAEYCGEEHSRMRTICQVHISEQDREDKTMWIEAQHKPWQNGERLYKIHCSGCHKIDGVAATGPALNLIWGITEPMIDGQQITVDENYVRQSILEPNAKVVAGYGPVSKMNSFQGKLDNDDINYLIAYLKYLKDPGKYDLDSSDDGADADAADSQPSDESAQD